MRTAGDQVSMRRAHIVALCIVAIAILPFSHQMINEIRRHQTPFTAWQSTHALQHDTSPVVAAISDGDDGDVTSETSLWRIGDSHAVVVTCAPSGSHPEWYASAFTMESQRNKEIEVFEWIGNATSPDELRDVMDTLTYRFALDKLHHPDNVIPGLGGCLAMTVPGGPYQLCPSRHLRYEDAKSAAEQMVTSLHRLEYGTRLLSAPRQVHYSEHVPNPALFHAIVHDPSRMWQRGDPVFTTGCHHGGGGGQRWGPRSGAQLLQFETLAHHEIVAILSSVLHSTVEINSWVIGPEAEKNGVTLQPVSLNRWRDIPQRYAALGVCIVDGFLDTIVKQSEASSWHRVDEIIGQCTGEGACFRFMHPNGECTRHMTMLDIFEDTKNQLQRLLQQGLLKQIFAGLS